MMPKVGYASNTQNMNFNYLVHFTLHTTQEKFKETLDTGYSLYLVQNRPSN